MKAKPIGSVAIAMMFLVIGMTCDHIKWLKYTLMIISVILCTISLVLSIKERKEI